MTSVTTVAENCANFLQEADMCTSVFYFLIWLSFNFLETIKMIEHGLQPFLELRGHPTVKTRVYEDFKGKSIAFRE